MPKDTCDAQPVPGPALLEKKIKKSELEGLEGAKAEWETNRAQERQGGRNNHTWDGPKAWKGRTKGIKTKRTRALPGGNSSSSLPAFCGNEQSPTLQELP